MVRDPPVDPPPVETVRAAAETALDAPVLDVTPIAEGLNAVYRVETRDGTEAALKAATFVTDEELLAEAALLSELRRETAVPLPRVLATLPSDEGPLDVAAVLTEFRHGRSRSDLLELSPAGRERLAAESGRHLAAVHDVAIADGFGPLRVEAGELVAVGDAGSWRESFGTLVGDAVAGLAGDGYATDADPRFADLAPTVERTLTKAGDRLEGATVDPAAMFEDYRPANLVLAPGDDADPLVRAVLDVGCGPTGDGLLDLALAEDALVDVPLGGTAEGDRLRRVLRDAYAAERSTELPPFDGRRYAAYRLYARTRRCGAFEYWSGFAREDDPDRVARRGRSFLHARLDEVG